jgi:hypothetical protein
VSKDGRALVTEEALASGTGKGQRRRPGWHLALLLVAGAVTGMAWEAIRQHRRGEVGPTAASAPADGSRRPRPPERPGRPNRAVVAVLQAHQVRSAVGPGETGHRPPRDYSRALRPPPRWDGPHPESLDQLERTDAVVKRLQELETQDGEEWASFLDHRLRFLAQLDRCIGDKITSTGGVAVVMKFRVDPRTKIAEGVEAHAEQSTLREEDDQVFVDCLQKTHLGSQYQKSSLYDREDFYWATQISVPVHDDSWYPWLYGKTPR